MSINNSYIRDNNATPLINLLAKDLDKVFFKSSHTLVSLWIDLIPYTPYDILASIKYLLLFYDIKPDQYATPNNLTKKGYVEQFMEKITEVVERGSENFVSKQFPRNGNLSDALRSFMGNESFFYDTWKQHSTEYSRVF